VVLPCSQFFVQPNFSRQNAGSAEQSGSCLIWPIHGIGMIAHYKTKMSAATMATLKLKEE